MGDGGGGGRGCGCLESVKEPLELFLISIQCAAESVMMVMNKV